MKDKVLDLVYWNSPHEERITVAFPFLKKRKRKRKIPFNDFDLILSWWCEPLAWSSGWKKILMVYHGLFSICIIPSGEKDCVPLCKLSVIVRHVSIFFFLSLWLSTLSCSSVQESPLKMSVIVWALELLRCPQVPRCNNSALHHALWDLFAHFPVSSPILSFVEEPSCNVCFHRNRG